MLRNPFVAGLLLEYRLESIGGIVFDVRAIKFRNKGTRKKLSYFIYCSIFYLKNVNNPVKYIF